MADFINSTHFQFWVFSAEELAALQQRRHELALAVVRSAEARRVVRCLPCGVLGGDDAQPGEVAVKVERDAAAGAPTEKAVLTLDEEHVLQRHFARLCVQNYQAICGEEFEKDKFSRAVQATALVLFRRFYLSNSVMEYSPVLMALASILLASKLEERHLKPSTLVYAANVEDMTIEHITAYEAHLMEGCNFHFRIFHPFRPLKVFLDDFLSVAGADACGGRGKLRDRTEELVLDLLYSDLAFQLSPAMLALGALMRAAEEAGEAGAGEAYMDSRFPLDGSAGAEAESVRARLQLAWDALRAEADRGGDVVVPDADAGADGEAVDPAKYIRKLKKKNRRCCVWVSDHPHKDKKRKKAKLENGDAQHAAEDGAGPPARSQAEGDPVKMEAG